MSWATSGRRSELPPDWARRRAVVLERDGYRCVAVLRDGVRCQGMATDVDHVVHRDDHRVEALQSLCSWCHKRKTAQEAAAARRVAMPSRTRPEPPHPGAL